LKKITKKSEESAKLIKDELNLEWSFYNSPG
jgi:hypothetical protein